MMIVDTNVISELQKPVPNLHVINWLDQQEPTNLYLTSITAAELMFGAYCVPAGKRAAELQDIIAHIIEDQFRGRILPFDATAAYYYGMRMALCREQGKSIGMADGQIASIAVANNLAPIATRDTTPFEAFRLDVINPFLESSEAIKT
jgi:predicted nucleic acid-binding protein